MGWHIRPGMSQAEIERIQESRDLGYKFDDHAVAQATYTKIKDGL